MRMPFEASAALAALAFLAAVPVSAAQTDAAVPESSPADEAVAQSPAAKAGEGRIVVQALPDDERMVCKRFAPPTSSKIARSKKICKPASEWEYKRQELARQNREFMDGSFSNTSRQMSSTFNSASGRDLVDPNPPR